MTAHPFGRISNDIQPTCLTLAGYALLYQAVTVIRIDQALLGALDGFAQLGVGDRLDKHPWS